MCCRYYHIVMKNQNDNIKNISNDHFKEHMDNANDFSLLNLPNICQHLRFHFQMPVNMIK